MRVLRVLPNPFLHRDAQGRPCALCPRDPADGGGGIGQFVGARVDRKRTKVLTPAKAQEIRSAPQETFYEYLGVASDDPELGDKLAGCQPIELPASSFYKQALRERSLLPYDPMTASAAGCAYREPGQYLRELGHPALAPDALHDSWRDLPEKPAKLAQFLAEKDSPLIAEAKIESPSDEKTKPDGPAARRAHAGKDDK